MEMTEDDIHAFNLTKYCSICEQLLNDDLVRDHCHVTGKFRGAAHNAFNINLKQRERIPILFYNLRGYDSHLIMEVIAKKKKRISTVYHRTMQNISRSVQENWNSSTLEFIDTFQFLSTSLEKLVDNFAEQYLDKFHYLRSYISTSRSENEPMKMKLLSRKGIYPYKYMTTFDRYDETGLPPSAPFCNDLDDTNISEEDYLNAEIVW